MSAPSFASFPERPKFPLAKHVDDPTNSSSFNEAGPSRSAPSFSSFPALPSRKGVESDGHHSDREKRHKHRDREDRGERAREEKKKDKTRDLNRPSRHSREEDDGDRHRHRGSLSREHRRSYAERHGRDSRHSSRREDDEGKSSPDGRRHRRRDVRESERIERRGKRDKGDGERRERSEERGYRAIGNSGRPPSPKAFFTDTTGDTSILQYGFQNPRDIPKFNVWGFGTVVGLGDDWRIVRSAKSGGGGGEGMERGKGVVVERRGAGGGASGEGTSNYQKDPSLIVPRYAEKLVIPSSGKLKGTAMGKSIREQSDYVPVGKTKEREGSERELRLEDVRRLDGIPSGGSSSEEEDASEEEENLDGSDNDSNPTETPEQSVRNQTRSFEVHLSSHPSDISSWIAYSTIHLSSPAKMIKTRNKESTVEGAKRGETEVAMSILERAFKVHPSNELSIEAQRVYLKMAQNVWDVSKVTSRYQGVLKMLSERSGSSIEVGEVDERERMDFWLEYISWREGRGMSVVGEKGKGGSEADGIGGVDDVVAVYIECLKTMQENMWEFPQRQEDTEANLVYLFLRSLLLLRQAGYEERATATFQAMLELTFFKPDKLRRTRTSGRGLRNWQGELLVDLEDFWDSEVPRIGEKGSQGWRSWTSDQEANAEEIEDTTNTDIGLGSGEKSKDPFQAWYEAELAAQNKDRLPARATDLSIDDEDPFRVILFSDIQDSLFVIQSGQVKLQLVYAALFFFRVPFQPPGVGTMTPFAVDSYMTMDIMRGEGEFWPRRPATKSISITQGKKMEPEPSKQENPARLWLIESSSGFKDLSSIHHPLPNSVQLSNTNSTFCSNLFLSLRPLITDPSFRTAHAAYESHLDSKKSAKLVKGWLSMDRENLDLWADYARVLRAQAAGMSSIEKSMSKEKEAVQVYVAAITGSAGGSEGGFSIDKEGRERLFADFAELEWSRGRGARCFLILNVFATGQVEYLTSLATDLNFSGEPISPIGLLRMKDFFSTIPSNSSQSILVLSTLYQYYANTTSPSKPTDQSLHSSLSHLSYILSSPSTPPTSSLSEYIHQLALRLIQIHNHHSPFVSGGEELEFDWIKNGLKRFGNNTGLMERGLEVEMKSGGVGRVFGRFQRLMNEVVLVENSQTSAPHQQQQQQQTSGDVTHSHTHIPGPRSWAFAAYAESQLVGSESFWAAKYGGPGSGSKGLGAAGLERVRGVLERGVDSVVGKQCLPLWMLYIDFEISQAREKVAKGLCYRAVARLGGCKELYLLPFSPSLRPYFTPQELHSWTELMLEKGIRMRVPTERYWDASRVGRMGMLSGVGDGDEDEDEDDGYGDEKGENTEDQVYEKVREEGRMIPV